MDSEDPHESQSPSESPLAHKLQKPNDSFSSDQKFASYRELYSSEISQTSLHSAEIGRAIPVHVFDGKDARIYDNDSPPQDDEDMLLMSDLLMQLGRLNTIKESKAANRLPELTLNTQVENVVPPRLRRRPVSEMLSLSKEPHPAANNRLSLSLVTDLDKLMESANNLQVADEQVDLAVSGASSPVHHLGHSRLDSTLSTDSFQTAGDGQSVRLYNYGEEVLATPIMLPKRPNADNLAKARQALHQYSTTSGILHDNTYDQDIDDEAAEQSTFHEESSRVASGSAREENVDAVSERPVSSFTGFSQPLPEQHDETLQNLTGDTPTQAQAQAETQANTSELSGSTPKQNFTPRNATGPSVHEMLQQPVELAQVHTPQRSNTNKALPAPPTLLARSEVTPRQQRSSVYTTELKIDDNEFYDIEDPVIVSKPVRSKSVKESISMPQRKSTRRKSRRPKTRELSLQLKPFSYNTLIHLLESVNGTVIGEEFESLNLPIKEKQLIEKIVDSLSRLTLDMVIDENRYEIGMQRLEKAHRVLEGFL